MECTMNNPILVDARGAADLLCLSERKFHQLRTHALFPADTELRLSSRAVRFRVERLHEFAALLAQQSGPAEAEPERLKLAREARKAAEAA
jgi:hypothetical protein